MKVHSARLLNERTGWFGLSVFDLAIVGYSLIFSDSTLRPFGFELAAFAIAGIVFLVLLNIRLRSRPKTIRDFLRSSLSSSLIQIDQKDGDARREGWRKPRVYAGIHRGEVPALPTPQVRPFHQSSQTSIR